MLKFIYFTIFCWILNLSFGQKPIFRAITISKEIAGVPLITCRKVVRDNFGFLWAATQEGLIRYNKSDPVNYSVKNSIEKHSLLKTDVSDIAINNNNILVALNAFGGVSCIDVTTGEVFKRIRFDDNIKLFGNANVIKLELVDSCVILPMSDGKVISYNIFTDYYKINQSLQNLIVGSRVDLVKSINGNIFLGISNGNLVIIDSQLKVLGICNLIKNKKGEEIRCNTIEEVGKTNTFILTTSEGIKSIKYENHIFKESKFNKDLPPSLKKMVYCGLNYKDKFYYCTDYGFFCTSLTKLDSVCKIESFSRSEINFYAQSYQIYAYHDQMLITSFNGIAEVALEQSAFIPIRRDNNKLSVLDHCLGLSFDNNNLWVASNNGLFLYDLQNRQPKFFNKSNYFLNVFKLPDATIMGFGSEGVVVLKSKSFIPAFNKFPELKGITNLLFSTAASYKDSLIYMAAEFNKGIFVWNFKLHTISPLIKDNEVNDIITNKINIINDSVFFVGDEKIMVYDINTKKYTNNVIVSPKTNKKLSIFMDMQQVRDKYYFAVYGEGLVITDNKFKVCKIVDNTDGISNLGLYKLFSVGDTLIFLSSNNGLFTYNINTSHVKPYFESDGIQSNGFEEYSGTQNLNNIFMGGINGFTIIQPSLLKTNRDPPKLFFQSVSIRYDSIKVDTSNIGLNEISVKNNYTEIRISFIGLNKLKENRVTYQYRIPELQDQWIDLKNQNFLNLIGIPPGTYTLEVKAANEDGVECKPISMQLHFLPKWYQTFLFKLSVALAIAGLLYLLYAFRIRQLKKVFSVRQKISSDLHDDIGSTLSTINMYSQIAQLQPNQPGYANTIQENTQEVLDKLDDIVWATNPKNDQVQNLVERIDTFARPLLQAHKIRFVFNAPENMAAQKISTATRQNTFLICKEAINNAVKYARCTTCTITIHLKNKCIYCTINDDGIGFDTTIPTERNGLLNMQQRAKAVKGKFELISKINAGTTITIVLPL